MEEVGLFVWNYVENSVKGFFKVLGVKQAVLDFLTGVALEKSLKIFKDPSIARRAVEAESFGRGDLFELVDLRLGVGACDDQENLLSQLREDIHVVPVGKLAHSSAQVKADDLWREK